MPSRGNGNGALKLNQLELFLYEKMAKGYDSVATTPPNPVLVHEDGKLRLEEIRVENTGQCCGTVTIWHDGRPVWFMQYDGWHEAEALPLLATFRRKACGCKRGFWKPYNDFQGAHSYVYTSSARSHSSMAEFFAIEEVHHLGNEAHLSHHEFRGRLLVPL